MTPIDETLEALDGLTKKRDAIEIDTVQWDTADTERDAAVLSAYPALREEIRNLREFIQVLIDNEPDDTISDGGHTVLDLWRHDAEQQFGFKRTLQGDEDNG